MPRKKKNKYARHLPPDFHPGYQYPGWVKPIFRYDEEDQDDSASNSYSSDDSEDE